MKGLTFVFCGVALTALLAGCGPKLAQTPLGSEEEQWQMTIQSSYSQWQPPQIAPPAIKDNMSKDYVEKPEPPQAPVEVTAPEAPADDNVTTAVVMDTVVVDETEAPAVNPVADQAAPQGDTYTVQKGDTLSLIAKKVYKDGRKYHRILKANEAVLKGNPNRLKPGMKLVVPAL